MPANAGGFSSLNRVIPKKKYMERQQVSARKKLGALEKHKDYVVRARKTHQRRAKEQLLRQQAQQRNPDEYYREMTRAKHTKSGTVIIEKLKEGEEGVITSRKQKQFVRMNSAKNLNILRYKHSILRSKIEKLKKSLHFIDLVKLNEQPQPEADEDDYMLDEDDDFQVTKQKKKKAKSVPKAKHTIFVKSESELDEFDPAKHFDTDASLVGQVFNRVKKSTLAKTRIENNPTDRSEIDQETMKQYRELEKYIEKEKIVRKAIEDLELALSIAVDKDKIEKYERDAEVKNPNFNTELKDVVAVKFKNERRR